MIFVIGNSIVSQVLNIEQFVKIKSTKLKLFFLMKFKANFWYIGKPLMSRVLEVISSILDLRWGRC